MDIVAKYKESRNRLFVQAGINPESKIVAADGPVKHIHYLEMGTGKPLIVVHGGGSHSSEWINILKPLSEQFHLYVVDRPGCGLTDTFNYNGVNFQISAVEFLGSFMDAVGLDQANFMANSMGGYFSICFALAHPERVEKLLFIGAPAGLNLWVPYMMRLMGLKGINKILMNTVGKPSISNLKAIHKQILVADINNVSEAYLQHCYYNQVLPGTAKSFRTLLETVLTLQGFRKDLHLVDQLNKLKIPVYFVWGDKDAFEKPDTGAQKASSIEKQKFQVVENAGHCPWFDQPDKCVSAILYMLQD